MTKTTLMLWFNQLKNISKGIKKLFILKLNQNNKKKYQQQKMHYSFLIMFLIFFMLNSYIYINNNFINPQVQLIFVHSKHIHALSIHKNRVLIFLKVKEVDFIFQKICENTSKSNILKH